MRCLHPRWTLLGAACEYLTVAFTQLHGPQSGDGCKLRLQLVSSREHEGLISISVHSENGGQLTQGEFFTCTCSVVDLGRPGWILLRPFPESVTRGTRGQIATAFIDQARNEREKDVLIYVKKGYEIAQNMLDAKEVWSLQLRQRFFDMEVNLWRVGGVKYGRERLDQREIVIVPTPRLLIRNSTNQAACAELCSQFRLVYLYLFCRHRFATLSPSPPMRLIRL